jgi:hypothetical protein
MADYSAFEAARSLVTAEQAAALYGIEVNGQHRAACPFHGGEHHNMSFHDGGFNCFVCGEHGDSIRLTQMLFEYARPVDALRQLNSDFHLGLNLTGGGRPMIDNAALMAARRKTEERELLRRAGDVLWEFLMILEWAAWSLAPKSPDDAISDLWAYALRNLDCAEYRVDWFRYATVAAKLNYILHDKKELILTYERFIRAVKHYGNVGKRNAA